jgi:hypothetical protein
MFYSVICTSNGSQLHLIKSYEYQRVKSPRCTILEAGLASIAAQETFQPVTISKAYRLNLWDASYLCPNPTVEAINEATKAFGIRSDVAGILSIGGELDTECFMSPGDKEKLKGTMVRAKDVHHDIYRHPSTSIVYTRLTVRHKCFLGIQNNDLYSDVVGIVEEGATPQLIDESIKSWGRDGEFARPLSELRAYLLFLDTRN